MEHDKSSKIPGGNHGFEVPESGHHSGGGEIMAPDILEALGNHLRPPESDVEFLDRTRPHFDRRTIAEKLDDLLEQAEFEPAHGHMRLAKAVGSFVVRKGEELIGYHDTLRRAEAKSGKAEGATYGTARFGDKECVVFAMNWNFLGGSVGEVVGEKGIEAIELAKKKKLPLVAFYTSGGMRQHENAFALAQMQRAADVLLEYLEETELPHAAVLFGQVWGGTSASTVPFGDTIIGVSGSDFGFAGSRVIENYQKEPVPKGSQGVESNYLNREVDVIVEYDELKEYLSKYLTVAQPVTHVSKEDRVPLQVQEKLWTLERTGEPKWNITLGAEGMAPALKARQSSEKSVEFPEMRPVNPSESEAETLFAQYERLIRDVGRVDGDYLINTVFDSAIPLYNHYIRGNSVTYPAIIGAITRIDNQPFMVIANQPSYEIVGDSIKKVLATPRPQDYQYMIHLMKVAKRRKLPVVTFTDTLGAAPTLEAEERGQSRMIATAMQQLLRHNRPVISIVIGALGSGGGLGTTLLGRLKALEGAQIYVAEPTSAASIVYGTATPTRQQVIETVGSMDASAQKLLEEGFLNEVIPVGNSRFDSARNIRIAIRKEYFELANKSERQLRPIIKRSLRNIRRGKIENR
jgi:acetyl-CoA carboxylase beta subunit/acetyl-CoA carboxylase alpha subunit